MTTLLLRGLSAFLPTPPRPTTLQAVRASVAPQWMTPAIRSNMSQRALRLMRSGD